MDRSINVGSAGRLGTVSRDTNRLTKSLAGRPERQRRYLASLFLGLKVEVITRTSGYEVSYRGEVISIAFAANGGADLLVLRETTMSGNGTHDVAYSLATVRRIRTTDLIKD